MIDRRTILTGTMGFLAANPALASPEEVEFVFIGDSITRGWPARLLPPGVVNKGVPGQMTVHMLNRFATDVLSAMPRAVHIWGGVNDLKAGTLESQIVENLFAMAEMALAAGVRPILSAILPARVARDITTPRLSLNAAISAHAIECGIAFIDYAPFLVGPDGYLSPENTLEGLHLTSAAYAKITPMALAALRRF